MPLPRKPTKHTIGEAINRAVREVEGGRVGHTYLRQHRVEPMAAAESYGVRRARFSDSEPVGGGDPFLIPDGPVDLTSIFLIDISAIDGPNDLIV